MQPPAGSAAPPKSLWRNPNFMKLWAGQTISLVGSQVTLLALPLTAILLFRASAFQVGLLWTVQFLPFVLFGLPAGVWVDRLRRKPILVVADIGRFVVLGSLPLAHALGVLHVTHLYAAAFLTGIFTVFFDVAYGSYLPSLVEHDRLVDGNSKLEISRSGAQIAGPGIGGVLIQAFTAPVAILADALSYLGSVFSLLLIREREPPVAREEARPKMLQEIGEGLRYVLRHRYLRAINVCTATLNLFDTMVITVFLLFAVRRLGLSAGRIGLILMVGNVGFLAGAFAAGRVGRWAGVGPTLIGASVLIGTGSLLIPLATRATAVPMLVASWVVASFGGVLYNVTGRSLVQSSTPPRLLGRTIATNRFIVWGTIPIGSFLGGVLGSHIGLRPTLFLGAAGNLAAFIAPLLSPVRKLREMPLAEADRTQASEGVAFPDFPPALPGPPG